jgi:hypothetical protein
MSEELYISQKDYINYMIDNYIISEEEGKRFIERLEELNSIL